MADWSEAGVLGTQTLPRWELLRLGGAGSLGIAHAFVCELQDGAVVDKAAGGRHGGHRVVEDHHQFRGVPLRNLKYLRISRDRIRILSAPNPATSEMRSKGASESPTTLNNSAGE